MFGGLLDLLDQVLRHGFAQAVAAHHDLHFLCVARQIDGALPRRVSAAHDHHAPIAERRRLSGRRAVIDARARVLRDARAQDARDRTCPCRPAARA